MAQRVLHVGKFFPPYRGGMEVFLADLLQAQRAQGIDAAALVHGDPLPDDPPWLVRVPVQGQLVYAPIAMGYVPRGQAEIGTTLQGEVRGKRLPVMVAAMPFQPTTYKR